MESRRPGNRRAAHLLWSLRDVPPGLRQSLPGVRDHRDAPARGFSEQIIVPARRLYKVSEALAAPVAALSEPVAVVVHGFSLAASLPVSTSSCSAAARSAS